MQEHYLEISPNARPVDLDIKCNLRRYPIPVHCSSSYRWYSRCRTALLCLASFLTGLIAHHLLS